MVRRKRVAQLVAPSLVGAAVAALAFVGSPARVVAREARASISGGADASGVTYRWTVTHEHTSPIVYVEFPHYHASLFFAPAGWTQRSTFLVNVGVADRPGVCTARAESAFSGIVRGRSGDFGMQVTAAGTRRGRGNVIVRFADGTESVVADVELPVPETVGSKYLPLVGLSVIAIVALGVRALRQRVGRRSR